MINALKKINKGVLTIILFIILLPIIILILLAIIQGCSNRKISHEAYETKMISAATKYFEDNKSLPAFGEVSEVSLDTLVNKEYIKSTLDLIGDDTCSGMVYVRNNGNTDNVYNYTANLECKDYKNDTLKDILLNNVVSSGNGLYNVDGVYYFKGDEVNNYITFYDKQYRIMSVENGLVKLIRVETNDMGSKIWDNKYNKDAGYSYGKNIYADSQILKSINKDYNTDKFISAEARKHIVANKACIGKRKIGDYTISKAIDCSELLEGQVIFLPTASDFALASTDPDCTSLNSKSCRNYNYLKKILYSSWTSNTVSNNTYQAYYLLSGTIEYQNANTYNEYNVIIYIDGNERVLSGNGTETKPYVIG